MSAGSSRLSVCAGMPSGGVVDGAVTGGERRAEKVWYFAAPGDLRVAWGLGRSTGRTIAGGCFWTKRSGRSRGAGVQVGMSTLSSAVSVDGTCEVVAAMEVGTDIFRNDANMSSTL